MKSEVRSNAMKVRDFTEVTLGLLAPRRPQALTLQQVRFLCTMVAEECKELLLTVSDTPLEEMIKCVQTAKAPIESGESKIAQQVDAFVDIMYFIHNAAAKNGIDCDQVFNVVHEANMAKRFADGEFHRDKDGKVMKPEGWNPANVDAIVSSWEQYGTWSDRRDHN